MKLKQALAALVISTFAFSGIVNAEGEALTATDHKAAMDQAITQAIAAAAAGNLEEVKVKAKIAMEEGEASLATKQDYTVDKAIPLMRGAKEHAEAGHAAEAKKAAEDALNMLHSPAPESDNV